MAAIAGWGKYMVFAMIHCTEKIPGLFFVMIMFLSFFW